MADVLQVQLYVNHVAMGAMMTWAMTCEEVLGGMGAATITVQDRTNSWEPQAHWDIQLVIISSGWVLYKGEIIREPVELPTGHPWRSWVLTCSDYNNELSQRLVGALDGKTWIDQYAMGFFVNIDPFAASLATDQLTVQTMLDHYFRVDGQALETTTYVNEYLRDFFPIIWEYGTLQGSFEELAALIIDNLQFWIDPDLFFHWVTIPPWQALAGNVAMNSNPALATLAAMMPQVTSISLPPAPANAADIDSGIGSVGFTELRFDYDGTEMPEQVYVKGGTGYVYNAPPIPPASETKTVVQAPTPGSKATYHLTFLATTKLWHTDATGYISTTYDTTGAGGPYTVEWTRVPWNAARNKGGGFWKLLSGGNAGKLVDNDTNVLAGYGSIKVVRIGTAPGTPGAPKIGVGGSGWTGEEDQDPNKRQAYLELPASISKDLRDSFGGQAKYRGATPTLRGSVKVRGLDGWRVGQIMTITDERLPSALNGKSFVIQRVSSALLAETELREYKLDWGDGPTSRYSGQDSKAGGPVEWPPPAIQIDISAHDLTPGPNSTQFITGQLVNGAGEPWAIAGKTVEWSFECYNNVGVLQVGQGSIDPEVTVTDKHGKARTKLTTGPGTNLVYYVFADVKAV